MDDEALMGVRVDVSARLSAPCLKILRRTVSISADFLINSAQSGRKIATDLDVGAS
jgi:hypothetical protein